jgi:hypothetical protein
MRLKEIGENDKSSYYHDADLYFIPRSGDVRMNIKKCIARVKINANATWGAARGLEDLLRGTAEFCGRFHSRGGL